jgi:nitroreductase
MNKNIEQLIHYATLAPSGHNTQPWTFSVENNVIRIFPDFGRRLPVVDPDDHALYISLGCALENLIIAAKCNGLDGTVDYFPGDEENVSSFRFG